MQRKILLLTTDLEIGGTPTVVRELARRLHAPPEVTIEVACLSQWGPVADQLRHAGIAVTALNARNAYDLRVVWRLIRLIRERGFETVFSFLIHANVVAAIASLAIRDVRFIQSVQTTQPEPRWHWVLQGIVQEMAERVVVPSRSVRDAAIAWAGVPRDKLCVISNAVQVVSTDTGNHSVRCHLRGPNARVAVGFLGRLDPIKRVSDLIGAIARLDNHFVLDIFGCGSDRQRLESEIAHLNLRNRVTFFGAIEDPQAALAAIDILVLPSQAEGFGLVLIEAMTAGVPIVATDVPGICDVVQNELTGLLVPVGRPDEIANAIRRITEDHALRERLIAQARRDVQARFSWPIILPQYQQLLNLHL